MNFVWKNIFYRFGIPKVIISDNEKQFNNDGFNLFCLDLAISTISSRLVNPQSNGQVKVINKIILRNLKARLEKSKSEWSRKPVEQYMGLPHNEQNLYGRDSILDGLWDIISYTSGDRDAELQDRLISTRRTMKPS